ncbi:MAG TPA: transglutaminase, partial [Rhodobiaceae bacterium]|nr:transglutaminase [Rhodobiaceae bacterium]
MLIRIRQETIYRYAASANYSMQILRAQPQDSDTQQVLSWRLSVRPQSRVTTGRDAYENTLQTLYIDHPHGDITLTIEGEVETRDRG